MTGEGADVANARLIDRFAPRADFILAEELLLSAAATAAYRAIGELRDADLESPVIRLLFRARDLPGYVRSHGHVTDLGEILLGGKGILLGERPGREIVLGAAGRFWSPVPEWYDVTPETFRDFAHARGGTIAMTFLVDPLAETGCRVTIETRITVADPAARHTASLYWHSIRPAAWLTTRGLLAAIAARATALTPS